VAAWQMEPRFRHSRKSADGGWHGYRRRESPRAAAARVVCGACSYLFQAEIATLKMLPYGLHPMHLYPHSRSRAKSRTCLGRIKSRV
jgi:hypothetical protein